jgi:hypothetical protein
MRDSRGSTIEIQFAMRSLGELRTSSRGLDQVAMEIPIPIRVATDDPWARPANADWRSLPCHPRRRNTCGFRASVLSHNAFIRSQTQRGNQGGREKPKEEPK